MSGVTDIIQNNIFVQLDNSKKIFDIIPKLAKIAEEEDTKTRKSLAEGIMQELLDLGEKMSNDANQVGMSLTRLVRRPD